MKKITMEQLDCLNDEFSWPWREEPQLIFVDWVNYWELIFQDASNKKYYKVGRCLMNSDDEVECVEVQPKEKTVIDWIVV